VTGSGVFTAVTLSQAKTRITNLTPNTNYDFFVQGVDTTIGVFSANSSISTFTTSPNDPKSDPSLDITNFDCVQTTNPTNGRGAIACSWTAAQDTIRNINFKCHCTSSVREPLLIRKKYWSSVANSRTDITFRINRDSAVCNIYAKAYYSRRPASRHSTTVVVS
jgi:hypothetical protein